MKRLAYWTAFCFLLGIAYGCEAHARAFDHDKELREQAENFCSCENRKGVETAIYLEGFDAMRVRCKNGAASLFFFGRKYKACSPGGKGLYVDPDDCLLAVGNGHYELFYGMRLGFEGRTVHVMVDAFLQSNGKVDTGKLREKFSRLGELLNNAHIKELMATGGDAAHDQIYDEIIAFMNHKLKSGHLPTRRVLYNFQNETTGATA